MKGWIVALLALGAASEDSPPDAGKCSSEQDGAAWVANGGEENRAVQSNYCSREHNGGCFLDVGCIEVCFQETYGYSEGCSTCFGAIPGCSIASGCMMAW